MSFPSRPDRRRTPRPPAIELLEGRCLPSVSLVRDVNLNNLGSTEGPPTEVNGAMFFFASDGVRGTELWKTDGTDKGTVLVKDINPGRAGGVVAGSLQTPANVGGTFFFIANDGVHGEDPWKSDGTEERTVLVKDVRPGVEGARIGLPRPGRPRSRPPGRLKRASGPFGPTRARTAGPQSCT